jgi:signal transduction histidine kinase
MSRAREIVAEQQTALADLRADRIAVLADSARKLTLLTSLGVLSVIFLSLIAIAQMAHQTHELNRAQEKLATAYDALEARVRERTRDLQRANDEIQRYAYVVGHDLRAPLVNIIGFTRELETALQAIKAAFESSPPGASDPVMAEAGRAIEEDIPEALRFIQSSTDRMDNLINAILHLSRLGRHALRPQYLDLNGLVDVCIASVQHRANEANATVAIDGRLPHLIGDRDALEQIVCNLLDNAVKYLSREREGRVIVRGRRQGAFVLIEIQDNGRGIALADQQRIFDLFRRAGAQDRPGEGIGLAHVRSLLRRMSGDIRVQSDGNSGSTFSVTLPYDLRPAVLQENSNESA